MERKITQKFSKTKQTENFPQHTQQFTTRTQKENTLITTHESQQELKKNTLQVMDFKYFGDKYYTRNRTYIRSIHIQFSREQSNRRNHILLERLKFNILFDSKASIS